MNVTGLQKHPADVYYFRLMGYDAEGHPHPSHEVTAVPFYGEVSEDLRIIDEFGIHGDVLYIPHIGELVPGTLLSISTELEPGTVVKVVHGDGQGGYDLLGRSVVSSEGCVILKLPQEEEEGRSLPLAPVLLVFGVMLVCLAAGAYVLRKP